MAEKGIQAVNFYEHTGIVAVADKPATPPSSRIVGPYRKPDGWYEMGSDGKEVKLFGSDQVVYKAAAAASDINKVNAYPKSADIGAAPSAAKGSVYSTFTLDAGVLSSYVANEAGTAWVATASTTSPGVYCGFATKFASLPTTRRDGKALVAGDFSFLAVEDGTNKAGAYRLVGTDWTFDFAFPAVSGLVETLATGGTPKAGFVSVQKDTDTFVTPTLTSGQKASVLQFDSSGAIAKQIHFYHDGTKQYKVSELIAQRWVTTKGNLDLNTLGADNAIETTWWTTNIALANAPGGLGTSTRGQVWQYFDGNDDGIQQLVIGDTGWSAGEWYRSKSGGTWSAWVRQLVDVWGLSVDNSTYSNGTLIVLRDTHNIKVRYSESGRAFRVFPATDWANVGSITANDAGWTLDGSFPTSGREEVILVPDNTNTKWIISRVGIKSHEDLIAVSKGHLPDASTATVGQIVEVYDDAGTKKYRLGNAATFGEYKGDFDATTTAITTTNIAKAGDWIYVTKDGTFDTVELTKGQFLISKNASPSGANLTDWLVGVARTDLVTLIQTELDDSTSTKAGQVTGEIVQKAIENRLLRKTYADAAARDTDDDDIKISSFVKVGSVWQQKTAESTYEDISSSADIPTNQAGLGTALSIESLKNPHNIHLNAANGAVSWDVGETNDGTWHYVMNVAIEDVEITFTNHHKIYIRNGVKDNEITDDKLTTTPGSAFLLHVTLNTEDRYVNIVPFGGGSGLKQNGSITASKTLTDSGLYAFPGDGVGSPTKARLEITLPKAASIGKNAPFFFHETSDSIAFGALLRTAAGEKTNGVLNSPYLMRAASGIWIAISNGVDGYSIAPLADDGLIPTFQVGLGIPFAIDKIDGAKAIHINSGSGAVSWDVANAVDGTWRYIMNVAAEDAEVAFTNHTKLYARNGVLNNEISEDKLLTRPGETYFVHLTNNSDNIYVNVMALGTASGMKRCGMLNDDKTLREPGLYGFSGAAGVAFTITLDEAPLVGENQMFIFHEVGDQNARAVTLKPRTGGKINGVLNGTISLRTASGVWLAVCNGVDGYNVLPVGSSLVPTVQAGLGTAIAIDNLDCGRAVHLNSKSGAVTWNVANAVDGTWQYLVNTHASDDVDITFLGHHKIYLRDGIKDNEVTTSQLRTKPGEWYIVHLTNNNGQVFVNIGKMFNRGPAAFKGLAMVAEYRPTTAVDIEGSNLITTGLDLRTADKLCIILQSSTATTFASSSSVNPLFATYDLDLKRLRQVDGFGWLPQESGKTYLRVTDWEKGEIKWEDADQGSQFVAAQTWAEATFGYVVPTGTTVGEHCDVTVNGISIGKAYTGTTTRLTVNPPAGKMIQTVTVADATQGNAVYVDPYSGELSVTPALQQATLAITVTYADVNRQSYSFAVFRTDNATVSIANGSPTWTNARFTVNEMSLNTAAVIHASGDVIVPRTGRVFVESEWWNSGTGDQRVTLRHKNSTGATIRDYPNVLSISSNCGYSGMVLSVTKGDRLNWVGSSASSIYWGENASELRLTSLDDTGKGFVIPTGTTVREEVTVTANAGALLVNGVSSVPGYTGTSMRLNVAMPAGQFIASVTPSAAALTAGVTATAADTLRGAIELAIPTGVTGTVDITVTFATLGLVKTLATANAGIDVTAGTLRWRIPTSNPRSLQVSSVSGTATNLDVFTCWSDGGKTDGTFSMVANATPAYINSNWGFTSAGNWQRVVVCDKTNGNRWYDVTMIIGSSYNANSFFIQELP
jgi:hypothetical protein